MKSILGQEIQLAYEQLVRCAAAVSDSQRMIRSIEGTSRKISLAELIAYQIGWGSSLINWYEAGIKKRSPEMPGHGFSTWDYAAIAQHFYIAYCYNSRHEQMEMFNRIVCQILKIIDTEDQKGQLDQLGVWDWCTLLSGKKWPLSKWIKVNTVSPYKRAKLQIKKAILRPLKKSENDKETS